MLRMCTALMSALLVATAVPALGQRSVAGDDDDEDEDDDDDTGEEKAPRDSPKVDPKKDDSKKKDGKKKSPEDQQAEDKKAAEEKAAEAKKADGKKAPEKKVDDKKVDDKKVDDKKVDDKKVDDKKVDAKKVDEKKVDDKKVDAKSVKKATVGDILDDNADDQHKRKVEEDARQKAESAAAAAEQKKTDDKARLAEDKKNADVKRHADTREQRLASARRVRPLFREEGDVRLQVAIEPGAVVKGSLVEVRFDLAKALDVADPKFGNREPLKNLQLIATVREATGKKGSERVYAVHSLGAPGTYGFHLTPPKDGVLQVEISGEAVGRTINQSFALHVGVWPPPDFDDEEKKLTERKGS